MCSKASRSAPTSITAPARSIFLTTPTSSSLSCMASSDLSPDVSATICSFCTLSQRAVHAPTLLVGGGQRVDSSGSISNHLEQKVKPDESGRDIYVVGADRASVWASGGVAGVESGAV